MLEGPACRAVQAKLHLLNQKLLEITGRGVGRELLVEVGVLDAPAMLCDGNRPAANRCAVNRNADRFVQRIRCRDRQRGHTKHVKRLAHMGAKALVGDLRKGQNLGAPDALEEQPVRECKVSESTRRSINAVVTRASARERSFLPPSACLHAGRTLSSSVCTEVLRIVSEDLAYNRIAPTAFTRRRMFIQISHDRKLFIIVRRITTESLTYTSCNARFCKAVY